MGDGAGQEVELVNSTVAVTFTGCIHNSFC